MMESSAVASRPVGVGIPEGQLSPGRGTPRTVLNLALAETFAVEWCDDDGRIHRELMHRIGGVWYRAPNGENYAATLRALKGDVWLAKQLTEKALFSGSATSAPPVPTSDDVSVSADDGKSGV